LIFEAWLFVSPTRAFVTQSATDDLAPASPQKIY
jgi:hypothetical protein